MEQGAGSKGLIVGRAFLPAVVFLLAACSSIQAGTPAITSLTVVNGSTSQTLRDGMTLRAGVKYLVRANASSPTQSVKFQVDTFSRIENFYPYNSAPFSFAGGKHTIRVTPYSKDNGRGIAGRAFNASFVIGSPSPSATPTPVATPTPTPSPSATTTPTATPRPTSTPTPTPSSTPSPTPTPTASPTATPSPSATATPSPSATTTPVATPTPSPSPVSATVSWSASTGATGYVVVWGTSSGTYPNKFDCGNELLARLVNHFTPGTAYYFAVEAYNQAGAAGDPNGVSGPSTEASYTP